MIEWSKFFKTKKLERLGKKCSTLSELADAISKETKSHVTVDSVFNAHRRHKARSKLKKSLTEYLMSPEDTQQPSKKPVIKPEDIHFEFSKEQREAVKKASRIVVTSALNNVNYDKKLWKTIENYRKDTGAALIIIPSRYKNPTSKKEEANQVRDAWWPEDLHPYMTDDVVELHEQLWLMAQVRIQATAVNPLTSMETPSKDVSAIFGHAQLAMTTVATSQTGTPKVIWTTGSISECSYSRTKAGFMGAFHHTMGALVVEKDGKNFHIRNLSADDKSGFYDLTKYYSPSGVEDANGSLALVTGDEHALFADPVCKAATYTAPNSIVNTLKPKKLVRHDLFDGYSISHHNRKDPAIQIGKHRGGYHELEKELEITVRHVEETSPKDVTNLVISSNHNDHLLRWMKEVNAPLEEPWNAKIWLELWNDFCETIKPVENGVTYGNPLEIWMQKRLSSKTRFISADSNEMIANIMVSLHGHQGANGSRGSIRQFSKLGAKTLVGHSHTPGIRHGAWQVGTSSYLRMDYTSGPSSWAHTHAVIHNNGKRQMIFISRSGSWRLEETKSKRHTRKKTTSRKRK